MIERLQQLAAHPDESVSAAAKQSLAILELRSSEIQETSECVQL